MRWLIVPALVVGLGCVLRAQETGGPRKTGKILLLKTGMAMEGDIEQVGQQMCIRRGASEVWIATDKTARLCADWKDAYAFMQTLIRPDKSYDRVRLARWCHLNNLKTEALEQAKVALTLEPGNLEAKQIVTVLERMQKEPAVRVETPRPAPAPTRVIEPVPTVDVTAESLIAFTTKVQPILMNTCANCHTGAASGRFHLERVSESGHKESTLRNLAVALRYVDLDRPAISPLLVKSITPHGRDATAPIRDRSAKPFQLVEQWIGETIRKNPHLKDYRANGKPVPAKTAPVEPPSAFSSQGTAIPAPAQDVVSKQTPRLEWTTTGTPVSEARPSANPRQERDWCDPDWFNEWAHPRTGQQAVAGGNRP